MGPILEEIISATVDGDEKKTAALARQAMADGMEPFEVIQNGYARGMEIVGEKFATLEYFNKLPVNPAKYGTSDASFVW